MCLGKGLSISKAHQVQRLTLLVSCLEVAHSQSPSVHVHVCMHAAGVYTTVLCSV